MSDEPILGVILAGGRGSRLGGRDKAWLPSRGHPLLCHAWRCLTPQVAETVVSSQRHGWAYRRLGIRTIADLDGYEGRGPLAAIAGALACWPQRWLAFMPVDVPAAPMDFVAQLRAALQPGDLAAALIGDGREQPLFALLSGALAANAAAALVAERAPSVYGWLNSVSARWVNADADDGSFANINTRDDWQRAESASTDASSHTEVRS